MAYRPTWQGHLKLSLVTCPVALYTAASSSGDIRFNLINPETNNRIKMVTVDPETGLAVERRDLVKGYEFEKGRYVLLTEEEIRSVRLDSTKTIEIERFVPEAEIDRLYWESPYFLAPDGKLAEEAFGVIREAMRSEGRVALGRVVLSTRERLLALEPRGNGIVAHSLRTMGEVRDASEIFGSISEAPPDQNMVAIAKQIIKQMEGPFDPTLFVDRYEQALKALIAEKQKGQAPVSVTEPQDTQVIDLMAALKASLQGTAKSPASAAPRRGRKSAEVTPLPKPKPTGRRRAS
jgi:DNA end-binding protein Ku